MHGMLGYVMSKIESNFRSSKPGKKLEFSCTQLYMLTFRYFKESLSEIKKSTTLS
jgi:hypothetical protein